MKKKLVVLLFFVIIASVFADNYRLETKNNRSTDKRVIYYEYSFYASVKCLYDLFYDRAYGNIEIGTSIRKLLLTADFFFGKYDPMLLRYGFGFSWGGRMTPFDWLNIVLGGYFGIFNIDPWVNHAGEYFYNHKYGTIGANKKIIWGARRIRFEISSKILYPPGYQGSAGFVYMATKRVPGRNFR